MKSISTALAIGVSALAMAGAANAVTTVTLGEGTGWHYGESHAANSTKMYNYDAVNGSQFTLKAVVTNALDDLSFVDGYTPGDVYSIAITSGGGSFTAKTQFLDDTYFSPIPNLNAGPFGTTFGPDWLSSSYGHFQAQLTPGTYTITIKDLCGSRGNPACPGFPAGWGVRLDSAVPELPTWMFMIVGVFGLGAALRTRQNATA